tara:strand:- start:267 stop:476 length:210 start_codon:yes stop_codon:yes gene_type:complete
MNNETNNKMKKFDYRREFMTLTIDQLKDLVPSLQADYDKFFFNPFSEAEAIKRGRVLTFVKNKIQSLEK